MPDCPVKTEVASQAEDIAMLTTSLNELTTTVRVLAEGQKGLGDLIRSQIEHNMEISNIKQLMSELKTGFGKSEKRLMQLEAYKLTTEAANQARSGLLAAAIKYGPIVAAILLALIGVGITLKELQP